MIKIVRKINRISDSIGRTLSYLIFPMILVIVYLVVMRYFFKNPPDWGFEISVFIYGLHMILPGGYCLLEKSHVSVDIFSARSSPGTQRMLSLFSTLVVLFVSLLLVYVSSKWAWQSTLMLQRSIHQTAFNPPIWWFKWTVPISAGLMALQAFSDLIVTFFRYDLDKIEKTNIGGAE